MFKKIILIISFLFFSINLTFADYGDLLYISDKDTNVYLDLDSSPIYKFQKGYVVTDLGEIVGEFKKVMLTSGQEAYIAIYNLKNEIKSDQIITENSAKLISKKFPLFLEPKIRGKVGDVLLENTDFEVTHNLLINDIWVKVKIKSGRYAGKEGYMWYKVLEFYNDDSLKKLEEPKWIINLLKIKNKVAQVNENIKTQTKEISDNVYDKILDLRENHYDKYMLFLEKFEKLKEENIEKYYKTLEKFGEKIPVVVDDIYNMRHE